MKNYIKVSLVFIIFSTVLSCEEGSSPNGKAPPGEDQTTEGSLKDISISVTQEAFLPFKNTSIRVNKLKNGDNLYLYLSPQCNEQFKIAEKIDNKEEFWNFTFSELDILGRYHISLGVERDIKELVCLESISNFYVDNCPNGYIDVTGNSDYGINNFCVMKYEAKAKEKNSSEDEGINLNGCEKLGVNCDANDRNGEIIDPSNISLLSENYEPVSTNKGKPWRLLSQNIAIDLCKNLNTEDDEQEIQDDSNNDGTYSLPTNSHWQVIARNIEIGNSEKSINNYAQDSFGDISFNNGHSDNDPPHACDAEFEYIAGDCKNINQEIKFEEKRTHTLKNGRVIWDFSGNVAEWVTGWKLFPVLWSGYLSVLNPNQYPEFHSFFGSEVSPQTICSNPTDNIGCGVGKMTYYSHAINATPFRGSYYGDIGAKGGLFSWGSLYAGSAATRIGFRCIYTPVK